MDEILIFAPDATAVDIMETCWKNTFNPEQFSSLDVFLDWTRANLWKFKKIAIQLECCLSTEEKCERIVSVLKEKNLINIK